MPQTYNNGRWAQNVNIKSTLCMYHAVVQFDKDLANSMLNTSTKYYATIQGLVSKKNVYTQHSEITYLKFNLYFLSIRIYKVHCPKYADTGRYLQLLIMVNFFPDIF